MSHYFAESSSTGLLYCARVFYTCRKKILQVNFPTKTKTTSIELTIFSSIVSIDNNSYALKIFFTIAYYVCVWQWKAMQEKKIKIYCTAVVSLLSKIPSRLVTKFRVSQNFEEFWFVVIKKYTVPQILLAFLLSNPHSWFDFSVTCKPESDVAPIITSYKFYKSTLDLKS